MFPVLTLAQTSGVVPLGEHTLPVSFRHMWAWPVWVVPTGQPVVAVAAPNHMYEFMPARVPPFVKLETVSISLSTWLPTNGAPLPPGHGEGTETVVPESN